MLARLVRPLSLVAAPVRQARLYSQLANATTPTSPAFDPLVHAQRPTALALPYHVRRNTRGSVPVYTDIRNGGTRYLVLIRNVEGNIHALADDLARTLFPAGSNEAQRIGIQVVRQQHLVITGGRWKNDVIRWLSERGF